MLKAVLCSAALLTLVGCSPTYLAGQAFPDRTIYELESALLDEKVRYVCDDSETQAQTNARVNGAHNAFETALLDFADKQTSDLLAGIEAGEGSFELALQFNREGDAWAQRTLEAIDAKYQCFVLPER